ncbi:hypothetical protein Q4511_08040 [Paracoccus sp. 1_MG-2023]|uniref:hypothetical protein n=1 Tax=unclassified Paracoccus (in: a-proteobacteria) TaxID=2688777 RepID=UPI001C08100A|nr:MULTISPECIES: hypothetical protein [unclassified Paracoccus (in: a-proteobacteria)]MBU2957936.1 hypothetical protein [Paracoccus sp. C2R09]MDO6668871.1 hypothetical protein [Paracoccus sp. 1_MG-2023]
MPQLAAFAILTLILFIGDIAATRTRSRLPSIFVAAVLFLVGYWTFFPEDIVQVAGFGTPIVYLSMYLLITNMGTLLSFAELRRQWRTVAIALAGIAGIAAMLFTVGRLFLDYETLVVVVPPLTGGVVSSLIMSEAAANAGFESLAVLAILIYVMQGFVGYPLTSWMLQREGRRVLALHRQGRWTGAAQSAPAPKAGPASMPSMFRRLPVEYNTVYFQLFRLGFVAFLAWGASQLIAPYFDVSPFVLCLVAGVIASSAGFLERQPLQLANSFGFVIMVLMLFILGGLNRATPEMLLDLAAPMFGAIVLGIAGMYVLSFVAGKLLGSTPEMAFACSLTALYGFPADYVITNEVVNALSDQEDERAVLSAHMLPPMLVAGFVTVTIVSVLLAGIFAGLL